MAMQPAGGAQYVLEFDSAKESPVPVGRAAVQSQAGSEGALLGEGGAEPAGEALPDADSVGAGARGLALADAEGGGEGLPVREAVGEAAPAAAEGVAEGVGVGLGEAEGGRATQAVSKIEPAAPVAANVRLPTPTPAVDSTHAGLV